MENNTEQSIVLPVSLEHNEAQTSNHESFFVGIQKGIDEAELAKQNEEQSTTIAELEGFGKSCGLTKEESADVLAEAGFAERLMSLRDKALASCDEYIIKVRKVGAVATTALVVGVSIPVSSYATEQIVEPVRIEKEVLPTYEEAMKNLHKSVMTDKVERVLVSVRGKDGLWKPVSLTSGRETSASTPDEFFDSLERGEEVELTHTHPLESSSFSGVMNEDEIVRTRKGEIIPRTLAPSGDADLMGTIFMDTFLKKHKGTARYKVIDPTGEWSYEISDYNTPFIKIMCKIRDVGENFVAEGSHTNPEEKEYLRGLIKKVPDSRFLITELKTRKASGDNLASDILSKINVEDRVERVVSSSSKEEQESFYGFNSYLLGTYFYPAGATTMEKNKKDIEFYTETAKRLGFSLKYTPNKKSE